MRVTISCNRSVCLALSLVCVFCVTFVYLYMPKLSYVQTPSAQSKRILTSVPEVHPIGVTSKATSKATSDDSFVINSSLRDATVVTRSEKDWSRDDGVCEGDTSFVKTVLHSPAGDTPIYVHPKNLDVWVSGSVIGGGVWEGDMVKIYHDLLKADKDLQFLDIGGNIGIYGLTMGKLGRKVLLVEPLLKNVRKLCRSVRDGKFQNVYVMHNALSSSRMRLGFGTHKGNVGGTYVRNVTSKEEETIQAVLLDDLLELFHFTKVAIKMDVEEHEPKVLKGGENFFNKVDVRYVLLEFGPHQKHPGASEIINFLARHHMKPYHPISGQSLDPALNSTWTRDILWKK